VHGTANVFEASLLVRLTDAAGVVLYGQAQMASSGTGTRGTFDFTVEATDATPGTRSGEFTIRTLRSGSITSTL
jgi:hypothetical protein